MIYDVRRFPDLSYNFVLEKHKNQIHASLQYTKTSLVERDIFCLLKFHRYGQHIKF